MSRAAIIRDTSIQRAENAWFSHGIDWSDVTLAMADKNFGSEASASSLVFSSQNIGD